MWSFEYIRILAENIMKNFLYFRHIPGNFPIMKCDHPFGIDKFIPRDSEVPPTEVLFLNWNCIRLDDSTTELSWYMAWSKSHLASDAIYHTLFNYESKSRMKSQKNIRFSPSKSHYWHDPNIPIWTISQNFGSILDHDFHDDYVFFSSKHDY